MLVQVDITVSIPIEPEEVEDAAFYLADILRDYSLQLNDERVSPRGQVIEVLNGRVQADMEVLRG